METEVILAGFGIISSIVGIAGGMVAARSNATLKEVKGKYDTRLKELELKGQEATAQSTLELKLTELIGKSVEYQQQTARASSQTAKRLAQQVDATKGMTEAINNMRTRMEDWDDRTRQSMQQVLSAFDAIEAGNSVTYTLQVDTIAKLEPILEIIEELRTIPKRTEEAVNLILSKLEEIAVNRLVSQPVVEMSVNNSAKESTK